MKSEKIRRAIGGIDADLIEAAETASAARVSAGWKKWSAAAAALVVLIGAAFLMRGVFAKNQLPVTPESGSSRMEENTPESGEKVENSAGNEDSVQNLPSSSAPQNDSSPIIWAPSGQTGDEEGLTQWEGKRYVTYRLYEALENAQGGETFAIRILPVIDDNFVFEGKTIGEYYLEMAEERNLPEKLAQLLKEGEDLRFGDKLWQEGNAEGIKWYKEFYDERVAFYGEALLEKYIADGQFLQDQVQTDLEKALEATAKTDAYTKAVDAFRTELCGSIRGRSPTELCEYAPYCVVAFLTKEDFAAFERADDPRFEDWSFDLAYAYGDEVVGVDPDVEALYGCDE